MQLANKVVLVTGSTTGIGEAIARRFAREGASVMIHGPNHSEAQTVAESIQNEGISAADFCFAELGDPEACSRLITETIARFGRIDILVNNAATSTRSNLETTTAKTFDQIVAVNLRAPLLLSQAALPHFRRIGRGTILNIGSVNGYCGEANLLAYSISKGGLMTLSRNLADALGPEGIRVNHFNVGWVLTSNEYALKVGEGMPEDWPERLPKTSAPSGRLLSPEQIAHFAVAFVSDAGGALNGAVVELEQYPVIGRNPSKTAE